MDLGVAMLGEVAHEIILRNAACLGKAVHSFVHLHQYVAVVDVLVEVEFIQDGGRDVFSG